MAVERKRPDGRRDQNSGADKLLLRVEEYRKLALELPLAPVAVGLLDRTIEILKARGNSATTASSHSARHRARRVTKDQPHPGSSTGATASCRRG
jgi:hypothetical protein